MSPSDSQGALHVVIYDINLVTDERNILVARYFGSSEFYLLRCFEGRAKHDWFRERTN